MCNYVIINRRTAINMPFFSALMCLKINDFSNRKNNNTETVMTGYLFNAGRIDVDQSNSHKKIRRRIQSSKRNVALHNHAFECHLFFCLGAQPFCDRSSRLEEPFFRHMCFNCES